MVDGDGRPDKVMLKKVRVSILRGDNPTTGIHDWERYVIVSDGVTTICEICDSREVRKLASRLERELMKARRERMTENGGAQSQRPASEPVCKTV